MAPKLPESKKALKRKKSSESAVSEPEVDTWTGFDDADRIDMASDDEQAPEEDDEEEDAVNEFPELDDGSSSEEDEEEEEDSGSDASGSSSSRSSVDEGTGKEDGITAGVKDLHFERAPGGYAMPKMVTSEITGEPKKVYPPIEPDYDSDSSTEDNPNRVGRIPMHWYDDLPHVGYDVNGKKVLRPAKGDELDKFLATVEDPKSWMTGFDHTKQQDTELSTDELDIIRRLQEAEVPDASYNPYEDTVEWFTGKGKEMVMPLSGKPEPKSRWQPSKWEKQKIMKIVRLIRAGKILPNKPKSTKPQYYSLWANESDNKRPPPMAAPKIALPKHAESYNPPEEYLPDDAEKEKYENLDDEEKLRTYLPKKYGSLRLVPAYENFIQERHARMLDLYLAPRIRKVRLNLKNPDTMLPTLPSPQSLKPFPVYEALKMSGGGSARTRSISVSPDGVWVVSGDEEGIVRIWEVAVGREAARWKLGKKVGAIEWCPRKDVSFFVVGVDDELFAFIPPYLPPVIEAATIEVLRPRNPPPPPAEVTEKSVKWGTESVSFKQSTTTYSSPLLVLSLPPGAGMPKDIVFHRRGDYFATVSGSEGQTSVWIHQVSKRHSQSPFRKIKGSIQRVLFHPSKPNFFVATQRLISIYDLSAQKLVKTLHSGSRWISSMDVHPTGDHLIVGGYDKKLMWFDLDLGNKPYKVLRYHTKAIRSVAFSPTYPLFASCSDDGTIQVFHARVYSDLMSDPLIVPLKVLKGHTITDGLGIMGIKWATGLGNCWLVSGGADGEVRVWAN